MDELQRAFDRIRQRIAINERGCWIWQGALSKEMYGQIRVGSTVLRTHRVTYLCVNGPIPRGKVVRHTCDNAKCCNPAHLVIGDHDDNTQDIIDRGRAAARRRVLTAEEVAEVIALRKAGRTKREICEALHCNWQAVSRAIDSTGVDVKKQGRPKGSKNLRQRFTEEVVERMRDMYATGKYTQQQLAEKFGCDQTYVSLLMKRARS